MATQIFMTGVSSFTGAHIARKLVESGSYELTCSLTKSLNTYYSDKLNAERLEYSKCTNWFENYSLSNSETLKSLQKLSPKIWINHGAPIKGYRSPDFDFVKSFQDSIDGLVAALKIFKEQGGQLFVYSGSFFEPDEGVGEFPGMVGVSEALSPYGLSKNLVWNTVRFFCMQMGISVLKVVIPNPIGPFENTDRLMPIFASRWQKGEIPELRLGQIVRDQLPVTWLANCYLRSIQDAQTQLGNSVFVKVKRPSGFVMTQKSFIELCIKEFRQRYPNIKFECKFGEAQSSEPIERFNSEPVMELNSAEAKKEFFDFWAEKLFEVRAH
jgi:UDP-glucose 4-epimerase